MCKVWHGCMAWRRAFRACSAYITTVFLPSEKLLTLHMPSDQIYALQKSLHGYSAATLSALKGLGLTFHDLITAFTPWPDVEPAAQTSKGSSQQFLPLSLDYAWIKSGLIKFINITTVVLKAKQNSHKRERRSVLERSGEPGHPA